MQDFSQWEKQENKTHKEYKHVFNMRKRMKHIYVSQFMCNIQKG